MMQEVTSLADLFFKAKTDKRYETLAIVSARNLGGDVKTIAEATEYLNKIALENGSCSYTIHEVNFCRDLVREDGKPKVRRKPSPLKKFKVIKERDVIDSNNYVRWQYTAPRMTFSDEVQSLGRIQREAQEQQVAIVTAQQEPSVPPPAESPVAEDFRMDSFEWNLPNSQQSPATQIESNPCSEGVIARSESPYRA